MKRKLLLFVLLLAGLTSTWAAQIDAGGIVSIRNVRNIVPGYTGSFDVVLNNTNSRTFIAFGMDITLPEGFTYAGCAKGELLTAGHNLIRSDQGNNVSRFSSIANPNADFLGTEGVLMTVYFTVGSSSGSASVKVGLTYSVDTYNATLAQETLTVGNTITLSEDETGAPAAISGVDVTVKRTLKGGMWNTLVLPFAVPAEQVETVFGAGTEIGSYNGNSYTLDASEENVVSVEMLFESCQSMEAHTPYIIKVPEDKEEFTVTGVSITTASNNLTTAKGKNFKVGNSNIYMPSDMKGTYTEVSIPEKCMFISDNKFMFSNGHSKLKAFRAYFNVSDAAALYDATASGNAPAITFGFIDGSATFINTLEDKVEDANTPQVYYTLSGQRVTNPTRGLYIVNGRKVVIK